MTQLLNRKAQRITVNMHHIRTKITLTQIIAHQHIANRINLRTQSFRNILRRQAITLLFIRKNSAYTLNAVCRIIRRRALRIILKRPVSDIINLLFLQQLHHISAQQRIRIIIHAEVDNPATSYAIDKLAEQLRQHIIGRLIILMSALYHIDVLRNQLTAHSLHSLTRIIINLAPGLLDDVRLHAIFCTQQGLRFFNILADCRKAACLLRIDSNRQLMSVS